MSEELLSTVKAAEISKVHEDTVRRAIKFGYLYARRVGRTWVITLNDLQLWIDAGKPNHRRKSTRRGEIEGKNEKDSTGNSQ